MASDLQEFKEQTARQLGRGLEQVQKASRKELLGFAEDFELPKVGKTEDLRTVVIGVYKKALALTPEDAWEFYRKQEPVRQGFGLSVRFGYEGIPREYQEARAGDPLIEKSWKQLEDFQRDRLVRWYTEEGGKQDFREFRINTANDEIIRPFFAVKTNGGVGFRPPNEAVALAAERMREQEGKLQGKPLKVEDLALSDIRNVTRYIRAINDSRRAAARRNRVEAAQKQQEAQAILGRIPGGLQTVNRVDDALESRRQLRVRPEKREAFKRAEKAIAELQGTTLSEPFRPSGPASLDAEAKRINEIVIPRIRPLFSSEPITRQEIYKKNRDIHPERIDRAIGRLLERDFLETAPGTLSEFRVKSAGKRPALVPLSQAQERFDGLSDRRKALDGARTAQNIAPAEADTDKERRLQQRWLKNPSRLDFQGVDTKRAGDLTDLRKAVVAADFAQSEAFRKAREAQLAGAPESEVTKLQADAQKKFSELKSLDAQLAQAELKSGMVRTGKGGTGFTRMGMRRTKKL